MKDDSHTREEHVAMNRIDIYYQIHDDPNYLHHLHQEMDGKDLACWCKSKIKTVSCHGDNYMHILSPELEGRDWSRSVSSLLIGDIRLALQKLHDLAFSEGERDHFLPRYWDWSETKLEIETLLALMKRENWSLEDAHFALACIVIDLELSLAETSREGKDYRLAHARWILNSIFLHWENRAHEPSPSHPVIDKPKKKEILGHT